MTDRLMKQYVLTLTAGAVPTTVRATFDGREQEVDIPAGGSRHIVFTMGRGFPYMKIDVTPLIDHPVTHIADARNGRAAA